MTATNGARNAAESEGVLRVFGGKCLEGHAWQGRVFEGLGEVF